MFRQVSLEEVQQGCNKSSKLWSCFLFVTIFLFSVPPLTQAQDPGIPDTVRIECDSLIVGQSLPVRVTIVNDDLIRTFIMPLIFSANDSGFALYDSVVFVNRMGDPTVLDLRIPWPREINGVSPDSLQLGCDLIVGNSLSPGNSVVAEIYMTGLTPGFMSIDTGKFVMGSGIFSNRLLFILPDSDPFTYINITPQFKSLTIPIVNGSSLPVVSVSRPLIREVAGRNFSIEIEVSSPDGFPVSANLESLTHYDDKRDTPTNTPSLTYGGSGGIYFFSWNSTASDIGIWRAVFSACDSVGSCVTEEVIIQVVTGANYLIELQVTESPGFNFPTAVGYGNFDIDLEPEIVSSGLAYLATSPLSLYDNVGSGVFQEAYIYDNPHYPLRGVEIGYLNDDSYLDVIAFQTASGTKEIFVLLGDGQNDFQSPISSTLPMRWAPVAALGIFNNDEFLDYAIGGHDTLYLFSGSATSEYTLINKTSIGDSIMTLTSSDFNNDGFDDLAVGIRTGLKIYLSDGAGNLSLKSTYSQMFGSTNIEVTNQGSDFNGDGIYDLCIATPSVGDSSSELVVYLGNGDGTFEQRVVRTVLGQIVANMPADFNGDGLLDIAYLNSAHKYLALIYGDGEGNFINELRFDVPNYNPSRLICTDFDIDGDIDIAVMSYRYDIGSSIFYYENQSNPAGFSASSITIQGEDNAQLELISPSNKILNRVSSTIPTGSYYRRNLNQNDILDDYASMSVTESGNYILSVKPDPTQPINTPFSVEFTVNGKLYRLAKDATMSESGYEFNLNFRNGSGYAPNSGSFIYINPPVFIWPNKSGVDFQLAADLDFNSIIIDKTIATSSYQPAEALSISDTTTFYWRIRPTGETEFGAMNAFNLVPSGPGCGDFDGLAGPINVLDLTYLVDYMFRGGAVPPDMNLADLTNDGNIGILDLTFMVDFIFRGGPPPPC